MKGLVFIAALMGCTDKPTYGDAARAIADATCERYTRCGWFTISYEECKQQMVDYLCSHFDCDYSFSKMDEVETCTTNYKGAACEEILEPCKF